MISLNRLYQKCLLSLFFVILCCTLTHSAQASQDAVISGDEATVYEYPNQEARVLEHRKAGEAVRVSTYHKEGWYKVKTRTGSYGWIWQSSLLLKPHTTQIKHSGIDYRGLYHDKRRKSEREWEPGVQVSFIGNLFPMFSTEVSKLAGKKNKIYYSFGGSAQVAFRVTSKTRVAVRLGYYSNSTAVNFDSVTGDVVVGGGKAGSFTVPAGNATVSQSGFPFLIGIDSDLYRSARWDFGAAFYAGMSLANTLELASSEQPGLNGSISTLGYAGLLNFSMKYWLARGFGFVFEFGGFFSTTSKKSLEADSLSNASVKQVLRTLSLRHMGPLFGAGLQFAF